MAGKLLEKRAVHLTCISISGSAKHLQGKGQAAAG